LSDSDTKINTEGIFILPVNNIRKVEIVRINPIKTTIVVIGGLILVIGLIGFHGVDPF
jgi:hypothetical protein